MHESCIVYRVIRQPVNNSLAGPSKNLNGHLLFLYRLKTTCPWLQCHDEELIWQQKLTLNQWIMCHNPGTWQNCSQVKLTSEESCQRTNCKTKYKLESQNPLGNNRASVTWEQLCQFHLGTIVPVSLRNNPSSLTWEQTRQYHLRTIVPVSLENNPASLTWEQSR